jgi:hypothetical protein
MNEPPLTPFLRASTDPAQAAAFFRTFFKQGDWLHMRAVPEPKDGRTPSNHHYEVNDKFDETVAQFLQYCFIESRAAFYLPGGVIPPRTHKDAVQSMPCVLVDFDKGDPAANLAQVEQLIGPATAVVESGGSADVGPKLHAYWKLQNVASGKTEIDKVCALREQLALRFGGDPAFKQEAQVIRIPGSVHFKNGAKPVTLKTLRPVTYALNRINLPHTEERISEHSSMSAATDNYFDFNNVVPFPDNKVERVLTQPILAEGASEDGITRFEGAGKAIGHFIHLVREGTLPDLNAAWARTCEWNRATLVPPWEEDRLRTDFDRLVRQDLQEKGPFVPPAPVLQAQMAADWSIEDWSIDRFSAPAPVRRWLCEGLIPQGSAGVFAAAGDAGKSMLAIWLAYLVGCSPAVDASMADISAPRFFGRPVVARGAAVVLTAEDDADEVHRRIQTLDSAGLRRQGKQRVFIVPMPSAGGVRAIIQDTQAGAQPTQFWQALRAKLLEIPDLKLVVLDPLSAFADADVERDNRTGAKLMAMLAELAATTGATVILTHHTGKGASPTNLSNARDAVRGVGALVNNGRFALTIWEADEDEAYSVLKTLGQKERTKEAGVVYLGGLAKSNAPGAKELRTLLRNPATGLLEDVTEAVRAGTPRQTELDDAVLAALHKERHANPRFMFAGSANSLEKAWKAPLRAAGVKLSRDKLEGIFDRLRERGEIIRAASEKRGGHQLFELKV